MQFQETFQQRFSEEFGAVILNCKKKNKNFTKWNRVLKKICHILTDNNILQTLSNWKFEPEGHI